MVQWKDGKAKYLAISHREDALWMRLVISNGKATGFYRVKTKDDWKKVGEYDLPSKGDFHFGLKTGSGPRRDTEDWARFSDFRILPLAK